MIMQTRSFDLKLVGILTAAILVAGVCHAQGTGVIYGTITDPSGAAVAGAKVEAVLTERGTARAINTDIRGEYVFSTMPIGGYEIRVAATGFRQAVRSAVTLETNQNLRVDAALTVGNVNESVTVNAESSLVESRSSVLSTLIDGRRGRSETRVRHNTRGFV